MPPPSTDGAGLSRRAFLKLAGAAAAASGCTALRWDAAGAVPFTEDADVVAVGTGAAGAAAALFAHEAGARVLVLEKALLFGGTTVKSGGVYFVPNNRFERERGLVEPREKTLADWARASFPQLFVPGAPPFGLPEREFALLEALYDHTNHAVEGLEAMGALHSMPADVMVGPLPDYLDTREDASQVVDRRLWPRKPDGSFGLGDEMVRQLRAALEARQVRLLMGHGARKLLTNRAGQVVGVEAQKGDGTPVRVRARRGVVFASGGYTHNAELVRHYQPGPIHGGCAVPTNEGDFVYMAQALGAKLGLMWSAWRAQVVLEQALAFPSTPDDVFMPPGDSMILVNRLGVRVVNEKTNYNERTRAHLVWDAYRKEYVNALLFMVYDGRTANGFGGRFPLPQPGTMSPYVVSGPSLPALADALDARLATLEARTGGARLAPDFAERLRSTVATFNSYARRGDDPDFHRGRALYDREWHQKIWSYPNPDAGPFDMPNPTMYPLSSRGPYHAIILGSGTLDTNGGPVVNERAQVVDTEDRPIPGLYGAGNCIAAPSGPYYFAGGGTLGPALAFGYLAGTHAAKEPEKELT